MNPRAQIGIERRNQIQVRKAFEGGLALDDPASLRDFYLTCGDYMVFTMARLHDQDQWIHDLVKQRVAADDPVHEMLTALDKRQDTSRAATDKFERALEICKAGGDDAEFKDAARDFVGIFGTMLLPRKNPFEPYTNKLFSEQDWIKVVGATDDALAKEKDLYKRVQSLAPEGLDPAGFTAEHMAS